MLLRQRKSVGEAPSWKVPLAWALLLVGLFDVVRAVRSVGPTLARTRQQAELRREDQQLGRDEILELLDKSGQVAVLAQKFSDEVGFSLTLPAGYRFVGHKTGGTRLFAVGPRSEVLLVTRSHSSATMDEWRASVRNNFARDWTHISISHEQPGHSFYGHSVRYLIEGRKDGTAVASWVGLFERANQVFVIVLRPSADSVQAAGAVLDSFEVE